MPFYEKDKELIEKFLAGQSQTAIARDLNLSCERIRQRLARNGITGHNRQWIPARETLVSAFEKATSFADVANILGLTEARLGAAIKYHAVNDALKKAKARWRTSRRDELYVPQRQAWINRLRELALQLGHTPRQKDMYTAGFSPGTVFVTFGSISKAMLAAGLIPNHSCHTSPLPPGFMDLATPGKVEEAENR